MGVPKAQMLLKNSERITNTGTNGGRKGSLIVDGSMNNIFPVVFEADRTTGIERYRKVFIDNASDVDATAFEARLYLDNPSPAGDNFRLTAGVLYDTQADLLAADPLWVGTGVLDVALSGGESSVDVNLEVNEFSYLPGGYLYIASMYPTGQTFDGVAIPGDSVQNTEADPVNMASGTWEKVAYSDDMDYPRGRMLKSGQVLTISAVSNQEMVKIKDTTVTDEPIGTGDGASTSPVLSTLASTTNGLFGAPYSPVLTTIAGGTERTITVGDDGVCTGYCSAGTLNLADGTWVVNPVWTSAPDNTEDITITYTRKPFSYTGNVATVELEGTVANAYPVAATHVCHCVNQNEVKTSLGDITITSVAGTYDDTTYPPVLSNRGTVKDTFIITMTGGTAFACSGLLSGSVGSGTMTADFAPINPATGQPYLTLLSDGWGGTWEIGDTLAIPTNPSDMSVWIWENVPPATAAFENNIIVVAKYWQ